MSVVEYKDNSKRGRKVSLQKHVDIHQKKVYAKKCTYMYVNLSYLAQKNFFPVDVSYKNCFCIIYKLFKCKIYKLN